MRGNRVISELTAICVSILARGAPRQRCLSERDLMNRVSLDVKAVRFGMKGRVTVGGAECQPEPLPRFDRASVKVEIGYRDPIADGDGRVVASISSTAFTIKEGSD